MARYIVNRLSSGLLTLFLFVTLLFFLANLVIPGDFVTSLGIMPADQSAAILEELGLNDPLYVQYWSWLTSIFTLSLGDSFGRGPVWDAVRDARAPTMVVLSIGLLIAFVLGDGWGERRAFGNAPPGRCAWDLTVLCWVLHGVARSQGCRLQGWGTPTGHPPRVGQTSRDESLNVPKVVRERTERIHQGMLAHPTPVIVPDTDEHVDVDEPWQVIVWNDPVNTMTYVVYVFRKLFGYDKTKATELMLQVHHEGRAIVSDGPREQAELDCFRLHNHGLWATMEQ